MRYLAFRLAWCVSVVRMRYLAFRLAWGECRKQKDNNGTANYSSSRDPKQNVTSLVTRLFGARWLSDRFVCTSSDRIDSPIVCNIDAQIDMSLKRAHRAQTAGAHHAQLNKLTTVLQCTSVLIWRCLGIGCNGHIPRLGAGPFVVGESTS